MSNEGDEYGPFTPEPEYEPQNTEESENSSPTTDDSGESDWDGDEPVSDKKEPEGVSESDGQTPRSETNTQPADQAETTGPGTTPKESDTKSGGSTVEGIESDRSESDGDGEEETIESRGVNEQSKSEGAEVSAENQPAATKQTTSESQFVEPTVGEQFNDSVPATEYIQFLEDRVESLEAELENKENIVDKKNTVIANLRDKIDEEVEKEVWKLKRDFAQTLFQKVRDPLRRGLEQDEDSDIRDGVELTLEQFTEAMNNHSIESISPDVGEELDREYHDSFRSKKHEAPEGTIIDVFRDGFQINGEVAEKAQVIISAGPPAGPETEERAEEDDISNENDSSKSDTNATNMDSENSDQTTIEKNNSKADAGIVDDDNHTATDDESGDNTRVGRDNTRREGEDESETSSTDIEDENADLSENNTSTVENNESKEAAQGEQNEINSSPSETDDNRMEKGPMNSSSDKSAEQDGDDN